MSSNGSRPVGAVDSMWLNMDRPNNLMVIASLVFLEGVPDWDEVLRLFSDRVLARYPVFRQRPVAPRTPVSHPTWVDDEDFDLDRHVHRVSLPESTDEALRSYVSDQLDRSFDRHHPLWEVHLVDGPGEGATLFVRCHHSLADGLALSRVLISLTEDLDGGTGPDDQGDADAASHHQTSLVRHATSIVWNEAMALLTPRGLLSALGRTLRTAETLGVLVLSHNPPNELVGEPGGRKLVLWSEPLPLAGLKDVAHLAGGTVNDVLMSAVAGALRTYQLDHGDTEPVDLITMVPVNVRPLDEPLPVELGNEFTLVFFQYPASLAGPLTRLAETKRRMDWVKHSPEAMITYGLINAIGWASLVDKYVVNFFANKAIGVTTNVIGPPTRRSLAGTPVTGLLGWVPGSGRQAIGVCIVTYAGTLRVGFMTDTAVVPDPAPLLTGFEEELDRLVRMGASGQKKQRRSRSRAHGHRAS